MIVAGVDIGNTTTEVLIAEVQRGSVTTLIARRAWTVGGKGSDDSVRNAARLVLRAEQAMGRRSELLLLPPLQPVITLLTSLPSRSGGSPLLRRLDDPSAGTPAGIGFAAGSHVPLRDLRSHAGRSGPLIVSVPSGSDFEEAADAISQALAMQLPVVGAVVAGDDAVLIANRIPQTIPIVDEADVVGLQAGEPIAVEVAGPGARVKVLGDPVALVAAFGLAPTQARLLTDVTLGLADARCAALALCRDVEHDIESSETGWLEYEGDGVVSRLPLSRLLLEHVDSLRPGSVRRVHVPEGLPLRDALGGVQDRIRDVFAVDLPSIRGQFLPREGSIKLAEVPISALVSAPDSSSRPGRVLAEAAGRPVHVMASEAAAAALGALTTPGAPEDAAVCDMGGGTIDLVWGDQRITAAGAGELLTVSVAKALGLRKRVGESVKKFVSLRVEAPHMVHYEDGSRSFVETPLPAAALGRLCFLRGATPTPFSDRLAPEEWRPLRLAIKQRAIGANVARCLRWLKGRPSTLLLSGGAALDAEAVRIVSESVQHLETVVGTANIDGTHGPRYGVALGLLLAFEQSDMGGRR
jgi:hypothetical protein